MYEAPISTKTVCNFGKITLNKAKKISEPLIVIKDLLPSLSISYKSFIYTYVHEENNSKEKRDVKCAWYWTKIYINTDISPKYFTK